MRCRPLLFLMIWSGVCLFAGCDDPSAPLPEPILYPVKGKVTADGKPLAHAVVTFLQTDEKGTTTVGETDDEGVYELTYVNKPGSASGTYKVAISYLHGKDGTIYGLAPRSGLSKPYGLFSAKERIVPEWSDLGRTKQRVTVPENGGTFDFDITTPLLAPPEPDPPASKPAEKPGAQPAKAKPSEPAAKEQSPSKSSTEPKDLPG